jgi:hypothetical protein
MRPVISFSTSVSNPQSSDVVAVFAIAAARSREPAPIG